MSAAKLTKPQLARLASIASMSSIGRSASRQTLVTADLIRLGYAEKVPGHEMADGIWKPAWIRITEAGRAALAETDAASPTRERR